MVDSVRYLEAEHASEVIGKVQPGQAAGPCPDCGQPLVFLRPESAPEKAECYCRKEHKSFRIYRKGMGSGSEA